MIYRATPESSTQSPEERRDEAEKILKILSTELHLLNQAGRSRYISDRFSETERTFLDGIMDRIYMTDDPVSIKELMWLRDIKDKYLAIKDKYL